ncbi:O-antigen polymerase [Ureibacillus composti]|nr:O-antigen polymerase [Ureibacillus composti]
MSTIKLTSGLLIITLFLTSILISVNYYTNISLLVSIAGSILLIYWNKKVNGNYINITMFFIVFSVLYGISGPINAVWGEGLHPLFSKPYNTDAFLISYALANIGLIIGIILFNTTSNNRFNNTIIDDSINMAIIKRKRILNVALLLALIASSFEIINLIRIGGISLLFVGKATYQSLSSNLTFTLPSSDVMTIAFAFLGLYLGTTYSDKVQLKKSKLKILLFLLYSIPFLLINTVLGQRGILLTLFICILTGVFFFKPLKRVKPKLVIILIIFYVFLSFLFANRSLVSTIPDNPEYFLETAFKKERIIEVLNPGANEFGAAFGNYSEFYGKYDYNFIPKLGETYIKGLVMPIPSFVYPGDKPQQITYEFRDEFFASEASRGRIAGTAYSSILEAYSNFNFIGVLFIYLIIGYVLQKIDTQYKYKNIFFMILYIASIPVTVVFHRSAFGDIFSIIFIRALAIYFFIFLCTKTNNKKNLRNEPV